MSIYFVGVGLPEKEESVFNNVKMNFHPNKRISSPAHITLVPPFYWTNKEILVGMLRQFALDLVPFSSEFTQVGSFLELKYGTVFLQPNKGEEFKKIAISLYELLLPNEKLKNYIPHLTLAQKVDLDRVDEVKNRIREMKLYLKLYVHQIRLFKFDDDSGIWKSFMDFGFGNNKA